MLVVATICFFVAKQQIQQQAFNQLESVQKIKAAAIERYAKQVEDQLVTLSLSSGTIEAMSSMGRSFERTLRAEGLGDTPERIAEMKQALKDYYINQFGKEYSNKNNKPINAENLLNQLPDEAIAQQYFYIAANQNPLGEKHLLDQADGRSVYHRNHNQYHINFRTFLEKFGYYDIFLVDAETGQVVYSVFKELDFATSLLNGPYKNTGLGKAFRQARELQPGQAVFEDFAIYPPSYDAPASFAATPIRRDGSTIGVLLFQLPLEPVDDIMSERAGMGDTGESFLVGPDHLMRSDSQQQPITHSVKASFTNPETGSIRNGAVDEIFNGNSGSMITEDYTGNAVLTSYAPVNFGPLKWGVVATINKSEAFSAISSLAVTVAILFLVAATILVFAAMVISKIISTPIVKLSRHIEEVQRTGDYSLQLNIPQTDEIGQTARTFSALQNNLSQAFSRVNEVLIELGKGNARAKITKEFPGDLGQLTKGINATAEKIHEAQQAQEEQTVVAQQKTTEAETAAAKAAEQARETLIIKQALDVCDTSVMIADDKLNIKYMNDAVKELMSASEMSIKKQIPQFSAGNLMGKSIEQFHADPQKHRLLLQSLKDTHRDTNIISGLTFNVTSTPILDDSGERLGTVIEWKDMTEELAKQAEEQRVAQENLRIRQALDNSSTCTMIADKDHNIIYLNNAMQTLMSNAEGDFRQQLGRFESGKLLGKNMNSFHKNPDTQVRMLSDLSKPLKSEFVAGQKTLAITANAITNSQGETTGTVVEWLDRTDEVAVEKEIAGIITAASEGDFKQRIATQNKQGFFLRLGEGLNSIMEQTHTAVGDLVQLFSALSEGDLTKTIDREYSGDFGRLTQDANKTIHNLREIIDKIQSSSTLIARAADEISSGNQDLSSRTEEQASSLEQTASSIEQITQIVRQSEDTAKQANELSTGANKIAREGDKAVEQTSAAMTAISQSSNKIANIIGVIDEIAFQTNLLALNAAVEAARAGEQGRGFAVVAGEVRNLAQRSATAAKEIKALIDDSVAKVDNGTELVETSRKALASIVKEIDQVSKMMQDITNSAREQTAGIEQVNSAVSQMDQMTQQNAALVEQASAASAAMAEQAGSLQTMIQYFRR